MLPTLLQGTSTSTNLCKERVDLVVSDSYFLFMVDTRHLANEKLWELGCHLAGFTILDQVHLGGKCPGPFLGWQKPSKSPVPAPFLLSNHGKFSANIPLCPGRGARGGVEVSLTGTLYSDVRYHANLADDPGRR